METIVPHILKYGEREKALIPAVQRQKTSLRWCFWM